MTNPVQVLPPVHTDFESAYLIADYPYGFTLRTQMKIWIETKTAKNGAKSQRVARCTLNPKTGRWNNPEYSTYSTIFVLYINDEGHVESDSVHEYNITDRTAEFLEKFGDVLNDAQKKDLILYKAANHVRKVLGISMLKDGRGAFYTALRDTLNDWGFSDVSKMVGA